MANFLYEKFKINSNTQLNNEDISSLTLLYLPLMGLDSFAIYLVMSSLSSNKEYHIKNIIDIAKIKTVKSLNNAFDKLEGLGLLKTYYNEEKGYLFELIAPLKEKDFIKCNELVALLETEIGDIEIKKIKDKYKPISKDYKEKTKAFSDVFTVNTKNQESIIDNIFNSEIKIENKNFNYTLFKMFTESADIDESLLDDNEFKRKINQISYIYNLNEEEMKDVVVKTIIYEKRSEYESLSKNAHLAFQEKYKVNCPKIETIKEDNFIDSGQDDAIIRLCNNLEASTPSEVLEKLSGMKPTPSELKLFEDLKNNTNLTYGAINFMIMMVSNEKNGELPNYNYFEKIASTWSRAKVKSAYDAYKYTEQKKQEKSASLKTNGKKQAPVPSWYKEYEKTLENSDKKNETNDNNSQSLDELKEIVKDLFKD